MMEKTAIAALILSSSIVSSAEVKIPTNADEDTGKVMSQAYWDIWNPEQQKKIDADIEANRKADASVKIGAVADGTDVLVEQITHDFKFGAHIFNFDQLGDPTLDAKFKSQFGTLFNSATVSFYWTQFEMQPGRPRFKAEYWDSQKFWADAESPKTEPHWRRPAPDPIIKYCKESGVRVHGHPLIWGSRSWQIPAWIFDYCLEGDEKAEFEKLLKSNIVFGVKSKGEVYTDAYRKLTPQELDAKFPKLAANMKELFKRRITQIAEYYKDTVDSWDVVNESAIDFEKGLMNKGGLLSKSVYGIMPADYTFEAFQVAQKAFPESVKLNINDYLMKQSYHDQAKDLIERGCKIDIQGAQMHLFNPKQTLSIAKGEKFRTPDEIRETMSLIYVGKPIHLSEITITAPDTTEQGRMMQAIITRNLYRVWFSVKPMMGITWWNTVDDCGAFGEPAMSGIFTRGMNPKPAFYALNDLINKEWKTKLSAKPDSEGNLKFRGFRGKYRISWKDKNGGEQFLYYYLK